MSYFTTESVEKQVMLTDAKAPAWTPEIQENVVILSYFSISCGEGQKKETLESLKLQGFLLVDDTGLELPWKAFRALPSNPNKSQKALAATGPAFPLYQLVTASTIQY